MKKIVLVGGGGHCCSVLDTLLDLNIYDEIVITDPALKEGETIYGCRVAGSDDVLPDLKAEGFEYAFVTIGGDEKPFVRIPIVERVAGMGFKMPCIIDPSAVVSARASVGEGTFIGKKAAVNGGAKIGSHCVINTGAILEHEAVVEDYSHVSVGAVLCGKTHVGKGSFIGAGSTVIQYVHVGNKVIVGANSTVIRDVDDDKKVYGVVKGGTN